jgi:hypothetical protein
MTTATIRAGLLAAFGLGALTLGAAGLSLFPAASFAQQAPAKAATVKAGKGEKVCRVKLKYSGEVRTWVCQKDQPCCVWHEINYVKCGTPWTGCL